MDSSSGCSFADFNVADGEELVVKLARNGRHGGDDECDRGRSAARGVNDLSDQMKNTNISQPRAREVNYFSRNESYEEEEEIEELNVVDNRQDYQNRPSSSNNYNINYARNNNAPNWRNNNYNSEAKKRFLNEPKAITNVDNAENNAAGFAEIKKMIQTVIDTQAANKADINKLVGSMVTHFGWKIYELTGKFNGLETHVKTLEKEITMFIPSTSKAHGKIGLPGKPEENPRDYGQMLGSDDDSDDDY